MDRMKRIQAAVLAFVMVVACVSIIGVGNSDADSAITPNTSWYNEADVSFKISTAEQLAGLAQLVNNGNTFEGKTVKLTKDITLSGEWTPIGAGTRTGSSYTDNSTVFKGTFDGNGHTISELSITNMTKDDAAGLFGVVAGGSIENLVMAGVSIHATYNELAGAIAGMLCEGGMVTGCVVGSESDDSIVEAKSGNGGIVGRMTVSGSIIDCDNFAEVKAVGNNAGGIVGAAYYTEKDQVMMIDACMNFGGVSGTTSIGGIVGLSAADVKDCQNVGSVSGSGSGVGGIVGAQKAIGTIEKCTNYAYVSCTITTNNSGAGGIVGYVTYDDIKAYKSIGMIQVNGCINCGNIVSTGLTAGGIVGLTCNWAYISNNVNIAEVIEAKNSAAGITYYGKISVGADVGEGISLVDNVSTTALSDIKAGQKDEIAFGTSSVSVSTSGNGSQLPSGFVVPTKPVPVTPSEVPEEIIVEGEEASVVIGESGTISSMTVETSNGSVTIKDGECTAGTVSVVITVADDEHVVQEAVKTYDVTISRIVSSSITITFYDVDVPSGKVPKVFSYKDGATVEEKVVSYTSSSVTIQTDHNTPFSIVLGDSPVIYDDDDYDYIPPYVAPTNTDNNDDDSKKVLACAAAAVVAALMAAFLVIDKKR